jgi:phosphatidylinositol alpha-1,6-mannosyltransferase
VNDFPPLLGGESTLYHALARRLAPDEAVVLAPRMPGDAAFDRDLAVTVLRRRIPEHAGHLSRLARSAASAAHLASSLLSHPCQYLVCGQLLSLGVPMRLAARLLGLPYAVFVHGADLLDYHDRPPWGRLARWVIEGADTVVANSRFTAALVERLLPGAARRLVVLPLGVDPPREPSAGSLEELRRRHRITGGPVLLSVSRLVPCKGHDVVLRALPEMLPRHPGLRYLVVGAGPQLEPLRRLAHEMAVADHVVFCGRVPAADLPAYFRVATLFVQLSRETGGYDGLEGFGLAFLEAASHGLPVIGGRSGGVPEAVLDGITGLLVPPLDAAAFASAVLRLLADPEERLRMSEAGRAWAVGHSWDRSAAILRSLWIGA